MISKGSPDLEYGWPKFNDHALPLPVYVVSYREYLTAGVGEVMRRGRQVISHQVPVDTIKSKQQALRRKP